MAAIVLLLNEHYHRGVVGLCGGTSMQYISESRGSGFFSPSYFHMI